MRQKCTNERMNQSVLDVMQAKAFKQTKSFDQSLINGYRATIANIRQKGKK